MSCRLSNPSSRSASFADNDVQAPLVSSVLAAAVDLPLPLGTNEPDDKSQSDGARTLGSNPQGSSTLSRRGKSNDLGLNTAEAQKKLGKFFKGLGPSKVSSLILVLGLILLSPTREIGCILPLAYQHLLAIASLFHSAMAMFSRTITVFWFIVDVRLATWQPFQQDHSSSR